MLGAQPRERRSLLVWDSVWGELMLFVPMLKLVLSVLFSTCNDESVVRASSEILGSEFVSPKFLIEYMRNGF